MSCDDRIGVHEPYLRPEGRVVLHNVSRMLAAAFVAAMRVACASDATGGAVLQTLLQEAPCGSTVEIPAGNYLVPHAVTIQGKTNCVFRGRGDVRLVTHYSPTGDTAEINSLIVVRDCQNVTFERFTVSTDNPPNAAGRIVRLDAANGTYDVRIDDEFPVTGWEHLFRTTSCDEDGTPNWYLTSWDRMKVEEVPDGKGGARRKYTAVAYEVIGDHLIRAKLPSCDLDGLRVGSRVVYRYSCVPVAVFKIWNSRSTTIRDVEIERCGNTAVNAYAPSRDLTIERMNVRMPAGSAALYSSNADVINLDGLGGTLRIADCRFKGHGDDILNVHAQAGFVKRIDPKTGAVELVFRNDFQPEAPLNDRWAVAGDQLMVYDPVTQQEKGVAVLESYGASRGRVKAVGFALQERDVVVNLKSLPSVHVSGCEIENGQARGFLLQTRKFLIENCRFKGLAMPGILIAPDSVRWGELAPTVDGTIRDCVFEKCSIVRGACALAAVVVKGTHDGGADGFAAGVHRNIRILDNRFVDCGNSGIYVGATSGVEIDGNSFQNCSSRRYSLADESTRYDIRIRNCRDVRLGPGNRTDKASDWLVLQETEHGRQGER